MFVATSNNAVGQTSECKVKPRERWSENKKSERKMHRKIKNHHLIKNCSTPFSPLRFCTLYAFQCNIYLLETCFWTWSCMARHAHGRKKWGKREAEKKNETSLYKSCRSRQKATKKREYEENEISERIPRQRDARPMIFYGGWNSSRWKHHDRVAMNATTMRTT